MLAFNLAPQPFQGREPLRYFIVWSIMSALVFFLGPSLLIWVWEQRVHGGSSLVTARLEAEQRVVNLRDRIKEARQSLNKSLLERSVRRDHQSYNGMLQEILTMLPRIMPSDVFVTSLSAEAWKIVIEGGARDATELAEFVEALKRSYTFMVFEVLEVRRDVMSSSVVDLFRIHGTLREMRLENEE